MSDSTYTRDVDQVVTSCGTLNPSGQRFKSFDTYCQETLHPETLRAVGWFEGTFSLALASYTSRISHERNNSRKPNRESSGSSEVNNNV